MTLSLMKYYNVGSFFVLYFFLDCKAKTWYTHILVTQKHFICRNLSSKNLITNHVYKSRHLHRGRGTVAVNSVGLFLSSLMNLNTFFFKPFSEMWTLHLSRNPCLFQVVLLSELLLVHLPISCLFKSSQP